MALLRAIAAITARMGTIHSDDLTWLIRLYRRFQAMSDFLARHAGG
jgi:hypothetical protein